MIDEQDRAGLLRTGLYIDGTWIPEGSAGVVSHVNAATGKGQRDVALAGRQEVDSAVNAAATAFKTWGRTTPGERAEALHRLADLIRQNGEEIATIGSLDTSTPIGLTRARNAGAAYWFDYYAGWTDKLTGRTIPVNQPGMIDMTFLEPVGVVAKILTWNTPLTGLAMSIAPALAAGCTTVIKPSELAPFVCLRFADLCTEAGIPPGIVNVIPGSGLAGELLVKHKQVAKISFTGGPMTARAIQAAAAESLTPAVFELGGKSANIVFADADLDRAATYAALITAISGQGCSLPSRLLVEESVYEEFTKRVVNAIADVRVGEPFDESTNMGPVITEEACGRILGMVSQAVSDGGEVLIGGTRMGGELSEGFYVAPTVVARMDPKSSLMQQEVFGPVLGVTSFRSEAEAIEIANGTDFGLAAYVHTQDVNRAMRLARDLQAGNIGINGFQVPLAPASPTAPFGGVKDSGYGREGGKEGILEFVYPKNVALCISEDRS